MGLIQRIEWLEEQMEELRRVGGWEDDMRGHARAWGVSEEEMRKIWLRAIGPRPCTCAEHASALLEELPRADDVESSD